MFGPAGGGGTVVEMMVAVVYLLLLSGGTYCVGSYFARRVTVTRQSVTYRNMAGVRGVWYLDQIYRVETGIETAYGSTIRALGADREGTVQGGDEHEKCRALSEGYEKMRKDRVSRSFKKESSMILYFSGTGNSRYAALRLGELTGEPVNSINQCLKEGAAIGLPLEKPLRCGEPGVRLAASAGGGAVHPPGFIFGKYRDLFCADLRRRRGECGKIRPQALREERAAVLRTGAAGDAGKLYYDVSGSGAGGGGTDHPPG